MENSEDEAKSGTKNIGVLSKINLLNRKDLASYWYNKGLVFYEKSEYEKAIESFDKALEISNEDFYAWYHKGLVFYEKSDYESALDAFEKCINIDPKNVDALNKKGRTLLYQNKYDEALKVYEKTLEVDPNNLMAMNYKAYTFLLTSEPKKVKEISNKVLSICENNIKKGLECFESWYQKGFAHLLRDEYKRAFESFEKAIPLKPDSVEALDNKGNALYFLEKYEDALGAYKQALNIRHVVTVYDNIGCVFSKLGEYEEAIHNYDESLKKNPEFFDALNNKGFDLYNIKKYDEALETIEKAIKANPKSAEAWNNKALIYRELSRYDEALESCKKALKLKPTGDTYFNTGLILKELGFYDESKKYLKQALSFFEDSVRKNPKSFEALSNKGLVLFNLERYMESILAYNEAIKINNKSSLVYIYKGNSYFSLKKYNDAIESYHEAIKSLNTKKEISDKVDGSLTNLENYPQEQYKNIIKTLQTIISLKMGKQEEDNLERALINLGNVYSALEDYKIAIYFYEEATQLNENSYDAWNNKGIAIYFECRKKKKILEEKEKECKKAEEAFDKALEINPKNPMVYNNRALTFIETKNYKKGEEELKTALRINPKCISANVNLSQFLFKFGNSNNSYEYIKKVTKQELSNDPSKVEAWSLQGQIEIELFKYDDAINSFNEAIYQGGEDSLFLLWIAYAKYLKVEFTLDKNPVKQKELMQSIIKDLDKALSLSKNEETEKLRLEKQIAICCILGCIYYKLEDHLTSKEKLRECICLCKEYKLEDDHTSKKKSPGCILSNDDKLENLKIEKIKMSASELVLNIWNNKIRPIWWRWWLEYPVDSNINIFKYNIKYKNIFKFLSLVVIILLFFHPIYPVMFRRLPGFVQYSNFFSVDWLFYIILIALVIFVILSPCINRIKIKDFELEVSSPPPFEFEYSPASFYDIGDFLGMRTK